MMYQQSTPSSDIDKRQRKQPSNQVWLDAIMSKTRSESPITASAVPTPVGDHGARTGDGIDGPPRSGYEYPDELTSSRDNLFREQLYVEPVVLANAMSKALKEMISEQSCSFIARGTCHLCGGEEAKNLVPVVNFCPALISSHSLCREHLRSMHRVRLEDIFAGKNQPTASKKSLKCTVCSVSCPCSKCQLERDAHVAAYRQWLEKENASQYDDLQVSKRPRYNEEGVELMPRGQPPSEGVDGGGVASSVRRESLRSSVTEGSKQNDGAADAKSVERDVYDEHKPTLPTPTAIEQGMSLEAEPKIPPRAPRFPKRAAKETRPHSASSTGNVSRIDTPRNPLESSARLMDEQGTPLASPSAASVLNCPDSEQSLVRLLSSLNRDVTPAVRYFAEAKEQRLRDLVDGPEIASSSDYYSGRTTRLTPTGSSLTAGFSDNNVAEGGLEDTNDKQLYYDKRKRKRDPVLAKPPETDMASASSRTPVLKTSEDAAPETSKMPSKARPNSEENVASFRKKAPAPLAVEKRSKPEIPTPSPRGRQSVRGKPESKLSARKQDHPPPVSSPLHSRKRKNDATVQPPPVSERKSPRAKHARTGKHGGRKSSVDVIDSDEEMKDQMVAEGALDVEEDGDDSDLDTNLDYCEVCLAAGDLVCCDVCPRSFHLSCLKMTESDLPEGDWQCAECKKPSYFKNFAVAVAQKQTVPSKCLQIVECLKSHPFSKPFLLPVEDVPHYTSVVKKPMDLSTIAINLKQGKYMVEGTGGRGGKVLHLGSFAEDVRLVWSNCKLFNDDGSGITRAADVLSDGFEKLYKDVLDFVSRTTPKTTAGRRDDRVQPKPDAHGKTDVQAKAKGDSQGKADVQAKTKAESQSNAEGQTKTKPTTNSTSASASTSSVRSSSNTTEVPKHQPSSSSQVAARKDKDETTSKPPPAPVDATLIDGKKTTSTKTSKPSSSNESAPAAPTAPTVSKKPDDATSQKEPPRPSSPSPATSTESSVSNTPSPTESNKLRPSTTTDKTKDIAKEVSSQSGISASDDNTKENDKLSEKTTHAQQAQVA